MKTNKKNNEFQYQLKKSIYLCSKDRQSCCTSIYYQLPLHPQWMVSLLRLRQKADIKVRQPLKRIMRRENRLFTSTSIYTPKLII